MGYGLRIQYPGAWYHLGARGNERRAIFRDDRDRQHFLELLASLVEVYRLRLFAYILMENHYHLLAQIREANLSAAMQWLGDSYAMWFNRRHARVGHVYQGRFKGILLDGEVYAVEVSRYLHLNPVRVPQYGLGKGDQHRRQAGLGSGPPDPRQVAARLQRLRQYRWSSYRAYVGLAPAPGWLEFGAILEMMGGRGLAERQRRYRQDVEATVREGLAESPWEKLVGGLVLGGAAFVRRAEQWAQGQGKQDPQLRRLQQRPRFEQVIQVVEKLKGEKWEAFRDRHGDWGRDLALWLGRRHCGLTLRHLGEQVGGGLHYAAVGQAVKRIAERCERERWLRQTRQRAEKALAIVEC